MLSPRMFASLTAVLLVACHADENGNRTPRCVEDSDCPSSLVCYRTFCVGEEGDEPDIDDVTDDDDAGNAGDAGAGLTVSDASAVEPEVPAASGEDAGSITPPVVVEPVTPVTDAAVVPATPVPDASTPTVEPPDSGTPQPMSPGSILPWPLGVPIDGLACFLPCTTFDEKGCRQCVQKTLKLDPESLCGREGEDYEGPTDPGFLGLRAAICNTLCLGASRGQGQCRRSK